MANVLILQWKIISKKITIGLNKALLNHYDMTPSEYIEEFKYAQIKPNESICQLAIRLKSLFMKAYGSTTLSLGEKRILCEQFLECLPQLDQRLLKTIATPTELCNIDQLAMRASRTARPVSTLNAITTEEINADEETEDSELSMDFLNIII